MINLDSKCSDSTNVNEILSLKFTLTDKYKEECLIKSCNFTYLKKTKIDGKLTRLKSLI